MIRIISVGKLRERYFQDAVDEYLKRIRNKVEIIDVKKEEQALKQAKGFIVVLDEKGKSLNSKEFAKFVNKDISFLIGPAEGFSNEIKKKADYVLSLSRMTLPHQMAKVFLIEQVYRAFTILQGKKYHK